MSSVESQAAEWVLLPPAKAKSAMMTCLAWDRSRMGEGAFSRCDAVWDEHGIAISCRDCELDSTTAICVDCFQHGDHEGHDYFIFRTVGGCCDCGDPEGVKPNSFCSKHRAQDQGAKKPSELVPPEVAQRLQGVVEALGTHLMRCMEDILRPQGDSSSSRTSQVERACQLLHHLCTELGDVAKWMIGQWLTRPFPDTEPSHGATKKGGGSDSLPPCHLAQLFRTDNELSSVDEQIRTALHHFYLPLLGDDEFRYQFCQFFVGYYQNMLKRLRLTGGETALMNFSVQLFHSPSLAPYFIHSGFVEEMWHALQLLLRTQFPEPGVQKTQLGAALLQNDFVPMLTDLSYLFSSLHVGRWVLFPPGRNMDSLLRRIMQFCHDMSQTFVFQRAQPEEDGREDGENSFALIYLEAKLHFLITRLRPVLTHADTSLESIQNCLHLHLAWAHALITTSSSPNQPASPRVSMQPLGARASYTFLRHVVSHEPVSIYLPLHKLVAILLDGALQRGLSLSELVPKMGGYAANVLTEDLVEGVLQKQVVVAQVAAEMWQRNGLYFGQDIEHHRYDAPLYPSMAEEFFLLQCALATGGPEYFLVLLLHRFELVSYVQWDVREASSGAYDLTQARSVWEYLLQLLLVLVTDRTFTHDSQCPEEASRWLVCRYLSHLLYLEPSPHSQLIRMMPDSYSSSPHLAQALEQVATFDQSPLARGEPGLYHIREERWAHMESYFPHYCLTELQQAEEKRALAFRRLHPEVEHQPKLFPPPPAYPLAPGVGPLESVLSSCFLHRIWMWQLTFSADQWDSDHVLASETSLHRVLQLLHLAVQKHVDPSPAVLATRSPCSSSPPVCSTPGDIPYQEDDLLWNMTIPFTLPLTPGKEDLDSPPSPLTMIQRLCAWHQERKELRYFLDSLFDLLLKDSHEMYGTLQQYIREYRTRDVAPQEDANASDEQARQARAAKQRAILRRFQEQQAQFLQSMDGQMTLDDMEEDSEEEGTNAVCAVCGEVCGPSTSRPSGRVGYLQLSQLTQFHRAKHGGIAPRVVQLEHHAIELYQAVLEEMREDCRLQFTSRRAEGVDLDAPVENSSPLPSSPPTSSPSPVPPSSPLQAIRTPDSEEEEEEEDSSHGFPSAPSPSPESEKTSDVRVWDELLHSHCSLVLNCCGHSMHHDCERSYRSSLGDEAGMFLRVELGEFFCPLCRALSNILLPDPSPPGEEEMNDATLVLQTDFLQQATFVLGQTRLDIPPFQRDYVHLTLLRSQIETLEFQCREQQTPRPSFLAEHRDQVQQLWRSVCTRFPKVKAHQETQQAAFLTTLQQLIPPSPHQAHPLTSWIDPSLLDAPSSPFSLFRVGEIDLLAMLVNLMYWKALWHEPLSVEQFDELVPYLIVAHGVQCALAPAPDLPPSFPSPSPVYPDLGPGHDGLRSWIARTLEGTSCTVATLNQPEMLQRQFSLLRQLYILRHTLFDVFFSELPDGEGAAPFLEVTNILLHSCSWHGETEGNDSPMGSPFFGKDLLVHWTGWDGAPTSPLPSSIRPAERYCPFQLIRLPSTYCFPYAEPYVSQAQCHVCHTACEMPLLCLHCGTMLPQCTRSHCTSPLPHEEVAIHMRQCHPTTGLFLFVFSTMVIVLQEYDIFPWGSFYVDAHGEEDENLSRGRPLGVSQVKVDALRTLTLQHRLAAFHRRLSLTLHE